MKQASKRQIDTLREIGVDATSLSRRDAQSIIARHFRPKSRRGRKNRR